MNEKDMELYINIMRLGYSDFQRIIFTNSAANIPVSETDRLLVGRNELMKFIALTRQYEGQSFSYNGMQIPVSHESPVYGLLETLFKIRDRKMKKEEEAKKSNPAHPERKPKKKGNKGAEIKVLQVDATSPKNFQKSIADIISKIESGEIVGEEIDDDDEATIDIDASLSDKYKFINNIMIGEFKEVWKLLYKAKRYERVTDYEGEIFDHISETVYDAAKEAQKYFKNHEDVEYTILHDGNKRALDKAMCNLTVTNEYEVQVMDPLDKTKVLCTKKYRSEFSRFIYRSALIHTKNGIAADGKFGYIEIWNFPTIKCTLEEYRNMDRLPEGYGLVDKYSNIRGSIYSFVSNKIYDEKGKVIHSKAFPMVYDIMHLNLDVGTEYYSLITPYFTDEKEIKEYKKFLKKNAEESREDDSDGGNFFNAC